MLTFSNKIELTRHEKVKSSSSMGKSLKKSLKSLTTKTYVVNPEREKSSKKDRNVRLKIGKSTFFLPTEESKFVEKFTSTLDQDSSNFVPIPSGKIFRNFLCRRVMSSSEPGKRAPL